MVFRPEINGLRAVSVLAVILFHVGFSFFKGGFLGVDVFFVISGYLIGGILLSEAKDNELNIYLFYEKRIKRIFPAIFLVLSFFLLIGSVFMLPQEFKSYIKSLASVLTFSSNFYFYNSVGYFELSSEMKPLLHTWSLAIEEQFYLFFPFLVLWLRNKKDSFVLSIFFIFILLSFASCFLFFNTSKDYSFYLLPFRSWELLVGAAIFLLSKICGEKFIGIDGHISALSFFLLVTSFIFFDNTYKHPGWSTLVPVLATAGVLYGINPKSWVYYILTRKFVLLLGAMSYSIYLWHQPLLVFFKLYSNRVNYYFYFGLLWCVAYISWRFVEQPIRYSKSFKQKTVFLYFILSSCCLFLVSLFFYYKNDLDLIESEKGRVSSGFVLPSINNGWCFYSVDSMPKLQVGKDGVQCWFNGDENKVKGLLLGDSFAGQYEPLWKEFAIKNNYSINSVTTNWCYPSASDNFYGVKDSRAYEQCVYNRKYLIDKYKNYDFIILAAAFADVEKNGLLNDFLALVDFLVSNNRKVVIMPSPKIYDTDVLSQYLRMYKLGLMYEIEKESSGADKYAQQAHKKIEDYVFKKKNDKIIFISREELFRKNGVVVESSLDGVPLSLDGRHISLFGVNYLVDNFMVLSKLKLIGGY